MIDVMLEYALFLAKAVTVVAAIAAVAAILAGLGRRERGAPERLEVKHLNRRYDSLERALRREALSKKAFKEAEKSRKRAAKERERAAAARRRMFVLDFKADIRASAVSALREEVTAVLTMATREDEVVVRLENPGGLVHDHGLAASQLLRVRSRGIPLTVAVDKVAASGGYMMACVANRILAAPFAVLGSIGVLVQLPNFHRWLGTHGIEFEQIKGGQFKRTLTLFGENTEADRDKARQEVEEIHVLFKRFVAEHRPALDIERVATGEHWYGARALELDLCDELRTSDDYLLEASRDADLYEVRYRARKPLGQRLAAAVDGRVERLLGLFSRRDHASRYAG